MDKPALGAFEQAQHVLRKGQGGQAVNDRLAIFFVNTYLGLMSTRSKEDGKPLNRPASFTSIILHL